jgi:hypothetical protein
MFMLLRLASHLEGDLYSFFLFWLIPVVFTSWDADIYPLHEISF